MKSEITKMGNVSTEMVNKNKISFKKLTGKKRDKEQSVPFNQEITIRFLEDVFPYREENNGSLERINKYLLDKGFANMLEPYYSTYEMRMEFIKKENLLDKYVLYLQKELQDLVFNNKQYFSIKEALLQGWFLDEKQAKSVGLT